MTSLQEASSRGMETSSRRWRTINILEHGSAQPRKISKTRRARAWDIAHKLKPLWTSRMPRATKVGVLTAAVEAVLMYGSESWTLTETLTKRLDGLYTRLL